MGEDVDAGPSTALRFGRDDNFFWLCFGRDDKSFGFASVGMTDPGAGLNGLDLLGMQPKCVGGRPHVAVRCL